MVVMIGRKYRNQPVVEDNIRFDSKAELAEYRRLKLRLKAGGITDLQIHPSFGIVVNQVKVCRYIADFSYREADTGQLVIVDVKSSASITPVYKLKKRLMLACLGLEITEVLT